MDCITIGDSMRRDNIVQKNSSPDIELTRLITLAANDDGDAFSSLCGMYDNMLKKAVARHCVNMDTPKDDLMQEAMLAFYRAVKSYRISSEVSFGYYARRCVDNALISLRRKEKSAKRRFARSAIETAHSYAADRNRINLSVDDCKKLLTEYEFSVFKLYLEGKSYNEIAQELTASRKSVSNAIYRAKTKIHNSY